MRASRLVQLILVLQRRGKCTARQLASELEVSVRTVYRDVEALSGIGVPVYADSGPGGGITLLDGYETRLTGLTGPEATALGLAGVPDVAAQLGLGSVLLAAQAKVDAALPPELRQRATRLRERFVVDVPGWFERPSEVPQLPGLSAAVWDGRMVEIAYRRNERTVHRRLAPLGLVLQGTIWYLVAATGSDTSSIRTYRVDRIVALRSTDEPVVRPSDFDLAVHWRTAAAEFDRAMRPLPIRIRLPRSSLRRLAAVVTAGAFAEALASAPSWPAERAGESAADASDGWADERVTLDFHAESVEVAAHELLGLAEVVEVLAPSELRERMRTVGAALVANHTSGTSPAPTARTPRRPGRSGGPGGSG